MSTACKGFILTGSSNGFEILNTVVLSFVQLCDRNTIFNKAAYPFNRAAHPFKNPSLSIGTNYCFFVSFTNDREADGQKCRMLQIGTYDDQFNVNPVGTKISLSIGDWGDCEFIMKSALETACKELNIDCAYFLPSDITENSDSSYIKLQYNHN